MALDITQEHLDRTDLVVLVGHDGLVEWSASRDREQVATILREIADGIEAMRACVALFGNKP